ncbi:MAG: polysaccharide deacetylase family protein [Lysinibacillus sp.]
MKKIFAIIVLLLIPISIVAIALPADEMHWGFKKATDGKSIEMDGRTVEMLKKYDAIYEGDTSKKVIYFTFDNGYENGYTESILDTLKKHDINATFFLTGHYVTSASDIVKRMVKDGHIIGNHSDGHPNMAKLSEQELVKEWQGFDKKLREVAGVERTYYARPPEGIYNEQVLKVGVENEYRHIFWSIAFKDWERDVRRGSDYAYNELMNQLHPGAIILMHTVNADNAEALPRFIETAKEQGYSFGSIADL